MKDNPGPLFNKKPKFEEKHRSNRYTVNYKGKNIARLYHKIRTDKNSGMYIEPNYTNWKDGVSLLSKLLIRNPGLLKDIKVKSLNKKPHRTGVHRGMQRLGILEELEDVGYSPKTAEEKKAVMKLAGAIGIPDRKAYGNPHDLQEGSLYDYVVQHHKAKVRGPHYDVRVGDDKGMYSWATGGKPTEDNAFLIQQPIHEHAYKDFEGTIPAGYGAGDVTKAKDGKVLITKKEKKVIHGTTADSNPQRYALIETGKDKIWKGVKAKPPEFEQVEKPKTKTVPPDKVDERVENLQEGEVVQPKVDGSLILLHIMKNHPELISHRLSKRTGKPIIHTERFFGKRPKIDAPAKFDKSVMYGEMYGKKDGKVIPAQELGGILNSNIGKSLESQKEKGVDLKTMLFDVAKLKDVDVQNMSYDERRKLIDELLPHLPKGKFHTPTDEVKTPEAAKSLLEQIRSGKHPLTREGVMIHKQRGDAEKLKLTDEHNVYIRKIFEGEGKYKGVGAGGFYYSHEPTGAVAGKVGTGLSDETRRLMWQDPKAYEGLKARVRAMERYKDTHALRAPSLIGVETTT
jgi:hypothetical protein